MIKVLDNVYDLVTLNMEQRFSERVALRFYDKETDEVTAVHYKDYARDIRRAVSYFQSTIPDIKGKKICLLNKNSYEYAVNTFGIILAAACWYCSTSTRAGTSCPTSWGWWTPLPS